MIETLLDNYYLVVSNHVILYLITIVSTLLFTSCGLLRTLTPPNLYKIWYNALQKKFCTVKEGRAGFPKLAYSFCTRHLTSSCQYEQPMLSSWVLHRAHIHVRGKGNPCYPIRLMSTLGNTNNSGLISNTSCKTVRYNCPVRNANKDGSPLACSYPSTSSQCSHTKPYVLLVKC
jgi:hypothetical protein